MPIRQQAQIIVDGSTNVVTVVGLQNLVTGEYPTDATVHCTLYTREGDTIEGAQNIEMPHVDGTSGSESRYQGVLDSAVDYSGVASARIVIEVGTAKRTITVPCTLRT